MKLLLLILSPLSLLASPLTALYSTLDPTSVSQHFAFYELYPKTAEGRQALQHAWELLSNGCIDCDPELLFPSLAAQPIVSLVNRMQDEEIPSLSEEQLTVIERLSRHFDNRHLQSFGLWDEEKITQLPSDQIDIARALLLAEMGGENKEKIRTYEASLDLMALQIAARLSPDATPLEKVRAINDYVFSEMRFRFPPHSLYAKEIDVYTFLPSVLDSRRGVCLGVSILYLCLAQRLGLSLQAITPPGHIYVRCIDASGDIVNIETTARGIDVPSEYYLSIDTKKLQQRTLKEVVGLAFMNQAAVSWHKGDPQTAVALYEKARSFLSPDDFLLNLFLGFNYLFIGKEKEGRALLEKVQDVTPYYAITGDTISKDYLAGLADADAIQTVFSEVDETRSSILEKQQKLQTVVEKFPRFRQGLFHLAVTWLQLGREKEALPLLMRYCELDPTDPTVQYYLSAIHYQRYDFNKSWKHLLAAEAITHTKNHTPRALRDLREALQHACPEPNSP